MIRHWYLGKMMMPFGMGPYNLKVVAGCFKSARSELIKKGEPLSTVISIKRLGRYHK